MLAFWLWMEAVPGQSKTPGPTTASQPVPTLPPSAEPESPPPFQRIRIGAAQACLEEGRRLFAAGDYEGAGWLLDLALKLDVQLSEAHFWRGRTYFEQDELELAAREFKEVLVHKPESVESLFQLGRVVEEKGQLEDARFLYRRVQALNPAHGGAKAALERLGPAPPGPSPTWSEVLARADRIFPAQRLKRRLCKQQAVTIVALGDSLTWGMGIAQPERDSFPALFATMLRERFQDPDVTLISAGIPGETSAGGLQRLEADVLAHHPDLVVVQYGGNDEYQRVPATEYQEHLRQIAQHVQAASAAVLLAAPPMKEPQPNTLFPRAAREVGAELQVPVADFDAAVKGPGSDWRGPFPLSEHPHEYNHARMAQSLYAAFQELVKLPTPFSAGLMEGAFYTPLGTEWKVVAWGRNGEAQERTLQLTLTVDDTPQRQSLHLPGGGQGEAAFPVALPESLDRKRSWSRRLWLAAQDGSGAAFDLKWLTVAPLLACPLVNRVPSLIEDAKNQGIRETRLGEGHLLSNPAAWNGLYDLGVSFGLAHDLKNLYLLVRVLDDQVLVRDANQDRVDCFFDLRPLPERGRPVYDEHCFALAAQPGSYSSWVRINALGPEPPGFMTFSGAAHRHLRGYSLLLTFPLRTLKEIAGQPVTAFGFDLQVHDVDRSGDQRATLAWSGRHDNLLNPSGFGEVQLAAEVEKGMARVAVF